MTLKVYVCMYVCMYVWPLYLLNRLIANYINYANKTLSVCMYVCASVRKGPPLVTWQPSSSFLRRDQDQGTMW